jgi:hypothetical protein
MKIKLQVVRLSLVMFALLSIMIAPIQSLADHSWGGYHWARKSNPFTLKVVDSNSANWDSSLNRALTDWSKSTVFDLTREPGDDSRTARKRCVMISGKIHSCNAEFGFNQWLGLASINISGGHITQATVKMNDSYLNSTRYNDTNRQHVMCQEIGHDFGLDHQDESGADFNTCMDYSNALDNPSPNQHDYDMLQSIYAHLDSSTTVGFTVGSSSNSDAGDDPNSWGQLMRQSANGRSSTYEKDNGDGSRTITHVFWTEEAAAGCPGCDHRYGH